MEKSKSSSYLLEHTAKHEQLSRQLNSLDQTQSSHAQNDKTSMWTESVGPIHIACLVIFLILMVSLIYLIKKYLIKFIGFYIVRKDYQRLQISNETINKDQSEIKSERMSVNIVSGSHNVGQQSKKSDNIENLKKTLLQNLNLYHPLLSLSLSKLPQRQQIKLPKLIQTILLIGTLFMLLTLALAITFFAQSKCLDQRFYQQNSYLCLSSPNNNEQSFSRSAAVGYAFLCALIVVLISSLGIYLLTKNYVAFILKINSIKGRKSGVENGQQETVRLDQKLCDEGDHKQVNYPTVQHLLGDDADFSKRSLGQGPQCKVMGLNNFAHDSLMIKISESDDSSQQIFTNNDKAQMRPPSAILSENKNILNTRNKNNLGYAVSYNTRIHQRKGENIFENAQFTSISKHSQNDGQTAGIPTPSNMGNFDRFAAFNSNNGNSYLPNNMSGLNHVQGLSDSTADIPQNYSSQYSQFNTKSHIYGAKEPSIDSSQDNCIDSRLRAISAGSDKCDLEVIELPKDEFQGIQKYGFKDQQNQASRVDLKSIIKLVVGFMIPLVLIGGIVFDIYFFLNMTFNGLSNALIVFAIALPFDFIILRNLSITFLSLLTIKLNKQIDYDMIVDEDDQHQLLLCGLHEQYETPIVRMTSISHENDIESQSMTAGQVQDKNTQRNKQYRSFQVGTGQCQITIIEAINEEIQLINQVEYQIAKDESDNITMRSQRQNKSGILRKSNSKQKLKFAKTAPLNTNIIDLECKIPEASCIQDEEESYVDIEEIPMCSANKNQISPRIYDEISYVTGGRKGNDKNLLPILMSHQEQFFDTPKPDLEHQKQKQLGTLETSQQFITFDAVNKSKDFKKSANKNNTSNLLDLLQRENSKGFQPENTGDFDSIKRYLDTENKEVKSIMATQHKSKTKLSNKGQSIHKGSYSINKNSTFEPQYASISKAQSSIKYGKHSPYRYLDLNQYDEDKENNNFSKTNVKGMMNLKGTIPVEGQNNLQSLIQGEVGMRYQDRKQSKTQVKKLYNKTLNQLYSVKKDLYTNYEAEPNISPFNCKTNTDHIRTQHQSKDMVNQELPDEMKNQIKGKMPPSLSSLLKGATKIGNSGSGVKNVVAGLVLQEITNLPKQASIKEISSSNTNTQRSRVSLDSIDKKVKKVLNKRKKKQEKQWIVMLDSNTGGDDLDKQNNNGLPDINQQQFGENRGFTIYSREQITQDCPNVNTNDIVVGEQEIYTHEQEQEQIVFSQQEEQNTDVIEEEENQSELLEVVLREDVSNFNKLSSAHSIDFYQDPIDQNQQNQEQTFEISHLEGTADNNKINNFEDQQNFNLDSRNNSVHQTSPNNNGVETSYNQDQGGVETSPSSKYEGDTPHHNQNEFSIIPHIVMPMDQQEQTEAENEAEIVILMGRGQSNLRKNSSKNSNRNRVNQQSQISISLQSSEGKYDIKESYSQSDLNIQNINKKIKNDKDDEFKIKLRIEEQQRKLKHFLGLARQLKSSKDEQKILEFMSIIKVTKKPLPASKINELKYLEIMSSPYNQSLMNMIKDEINRFGKKSGGEKPPSALKKSRESKSLQRQNVKTGQMMQKLTGIYGTNPSSAIISNRKDTANTRVSSAGRDSAMSREGKPPLVMVSNKLATSKSRHFNNAVALTSAQKNNPPGRKSHDTSSKPKNNNRALGMAAQAFSYQKEQQMQQNDEDSQVNQGMSDNEDNNQHFDGINSEQEPVQNLDKSMFGNITVESTDFNNLQNFYANGFPKN